MKNTTLAEHFFRHEYAKLVAILCRRVGAEYFDSVEDAVQRALLAAMESWPVASIPDKPSAWLYKTALNTLIDEIRKQSGREHILARQQETLLDQVALMPEVSFSEEFQDDMVKMLFVCCHEQVPRESQLVFALKAMCGFSIQEIAQRLFISEANAYKRYGRARNYLKQHALEFAELAAEKYPLRLPAVHRIIYLIFTEGYLSVNQAHSLRKEMCDEAIRLALLLANSPHGQATETYSLIALMYFHVARLDARQDVSGGLILLEDQDRSLWDKAKIYTGFEWLQKSAQGHSFSRYHAEAAIAAEHCLATSFADTRWDRICDNYYLLEQTVCSPIHRLNRAVALAQWQGAEVGLKILADFDAPTWLLNSFVWAAVLAYLYQVAGDIEQAEKYRLSAFERAPTPATQQLLAQRLCGI